MGFTINSIKSRILARLNDLNQQIFTDTVLLPYAQDAADELQGELEKHGLLVLEKISATIVVPANTVSLSAASLLPSDMLEPQKIEERLSGTTDLFMPMIRRQWEPDVLATDQLRYWVYREEDIKFVGATTIRDIKIFYLKKLITISALSDTVNVNNAQLFMITKTAAFAARNTGENPTRADALDKDAEDNMDWLISIGAKSKQGTRTRRRPFVITGRRRWI